MKWGLLWKKQFLEVVVKNRKKTQNVRQLIAKII